MLENDVTSENDVKSQILENKQMAFIIYILYLANIVVPLLGLVGVILAYSNKGKVSPELDTHYQFQIRTFWIGILYVVIGIITSLILIGYLVILFYVIWKIVRCVKGIELLNSGKPEQNPKRWMF